MAFVPADEPDSVVSVGYRSICRGTFAFPFVPAATCLLRQQLLPPKPLLARKYFCTSPNQQDMWRAFHDPPRHGNGGHKISHPGDSTRAPLGAFHPSGIQLNSARAV